MRKVRQVAKESQNSWVTGLFGTLEPAASLRLVVLVARGLAKMALEINRALDVSIGYTQFVTTKLLQMSGLCVDKKLVQGWDLDVVNQAKIDSHANLAQVVHGLFAADLLCSA